MVEVVLCQQGRWQITNNLKRKMKEKEDEKEKQKHVIVVQYTKSTNRSQGKNRTGRKIFIPREAWKQKIAGMKKKLEES